VLKGSFQGRAVAVKRLLKHFVTIADQEVSLLQDADEHSNVIRYFCKEQRDNFLYIALELCPASLADIFDSPEKWPELVAAFDSKRALRQIASGVAHLHSLKIVHRDIKPPNILVTLARHNGKTASSVPALRLLISDFGLCKRLELDESSFLQTVNHAAGSFGYRAPEVLRGDVNPNESPQPSSSSSKNLLEAESSTQRTKKLTRSLDIFSLGCIFYYVLTAGEHPFGGRFEREVNILKGESCLNRLDGLGEEAHEAQSLIASMISDDAASRCGTPRGDAIPALILSTDRSRTRSCCIPSSGHQQRDSPSFAKPATASRSWTESRRKWPSWISNAERWMWSARTGSNASTGAWSKTWASTASTTGRRCETCCE
jgi:serine/threonine-protein kinase/endoribonuclease IRE1